MPLTVVAIITAKAGSEETIQDALKTLVAASRSDQGCLSYELQRSTTDPAVFLTLEQWESEADLEAHMNTPALAAAVQAAGPELAKPFEIISTRRVEV